MTKQDKDEFQFHLRCKCGCDMEGLFALDDAEERLYCECGLIWEVKRPVQGGDNHD